MFSTLVASVVVVTSLVGARGATTAYEDVQHRFSLQLPPHWEFAPLPGDTGGAYFKRVEQGTVANATVRVMKFTQLVDLDTFAARVGDASDQEPGYRLLINQSTRVAGSPAISRRFVAAINGDVKWTKMVEQRILVVGNLGYVVHVETLADAFPLFQEDFNKFFEGFNPGTGKAPVKVDTPKQRTPARMLVGKWEGAGHALELSPSGTAILDRTPGSYHIDAATLVLQLNGKNMMFEYELNGDSLRLSGGGFAGGQNFHRVTGQRPTAPQPQ